jgi:hypothetical protein
MKLLFISALFLAPVLAQADPLRSDMSCEIILHERSTGAQSSAMVAISRVSNPTDAWSTAVFLGKDPYAATIGLSATAQFPDLMVVEIAMGHQPDMGLGAGHARPGTLVEVTRVRYDGDLKLIFELPTLGVTVTCKPFGLGSESYVPVS